MTTTFQNDLESRLSDRSWDAKISRRVLGERKRQLKTRLEIFGPRQCSHRRMALQGTEDFKLKEIDILFCHLATCIHIGYKCKYILGLPGTSIPS